MLPITHHRFRTNIYTGNFHMHAVPMKANSVIQRSANYVCIHITLPAYHCIWSTNAQDLYRFKSNLLYLTIWANILPLSQYPPPPPTRQWCWSAELAWTRCTIYSPNPSPPPQSQFGPQLPPMGCLRFWMCLLSYHWANWQISRPVSWEGRSVWL